MCVSLRKGDISFTLKKGNGFNSNIQNLLIDEVKSTIPKKVKQKIDSRIEDKKLILNLNNLGIEIKEAYFFPFKEDVIDYSINQKLKNANNQTELSMNLLEKSNVSSLSAGVLKTNAGSYEVELNSRFCRYTIDVKS
jgi:hypothetical protein